METLNEFCSKHTDARAPLKEWFVYVEHASWENFADVRRTYASADALGDKVIFNIKGNTYRLIAIVNYESRHVLVRWIGTHAEYNWLTEGEIKDL